MLKTAAAGVGRPLLLLLGVAFAGYLVWEIGAVAVWKSIRALGGWLVLLVAFPYALVLALDTLAWWVLFPGRTVPFGTLLRARLAGEAVNLTTPTASVGGEPLKAYLLSRHIGLAEGFAAVIADKTTVVAGQGLFLAAGLGAAVSMLPPGSPVMIGMLGLLTIEVVAVAGFVLVQTRGIFGGGGRLMRRLGLGAGVQLQGGLEELDRALLTFYRERKGRLLHSTILHALAWAGSGLEIYLVLALLGLPVSLATAVVIESFGAAVKFASFMIPASMGALEGGYVAFFSAFGAGGAVGLSYAVIRRLREATWVAAGFVALAVTGRPEPLADTGARET